VGGFSSIVTLGFLLGMRHATDPDHVIAISTILGRDRGPWRAAMTGLLWGVGHALTVGLVGVAAVGFNWVISARVGQGLELSVGVMLILLGIAGVARAHMGPAVTEPLRRRRSDVSRRRVGDLSTLRARMWPLAVGIVHGLAGSAAIMLLILSAISDPRWAIAYLIVFGLGTLAGMVLVTIGLGLLLQYARCHSEALAHRLRLASGMASIGFGVSLTYEIGIHQGLFAFVAAAAR
jgi:high-affinity nickel-transport protein